MNKCQLGQSKPWAKPVCTHPRSWILHSGVPGFMLETGPHGRHVLRGREESATGLNKRDFSYCSVNCLGVCQVHSVAWFGTTRELRMVFAYLKGCKMNGKTCNRNHTCPTKPEVFII